MAAQQRSSAAQPQLTAPLLSSFAQLIHTRHKSLCFSIITAVTLLLLSQRPTTHLKQITMSRHRAVRNLDLDEELAEDDYFDEDPYG